ncbi:DUF1553 domain-containing protein [bacterium]|nr:DUF1553 domain-containing protein [bacterium]
MKSASRIMLPALATLLLSVAFSNTSLATRNLARADEASRPAAPPLPEPAPRPPLHPRIDALIEARLNGVTVAPQSDDAEFLRRVYLDLAGRIPTAMEAREFLADSTPDKRERLVDGLLSGPEYPRRMRELFHAMLLERRGDNDEWTVFLRNAFEQNLPWHLIARAILKPDENDEQLRGAAFFMTQRLVSEGAMAPVDVPGLTRDVARLLAGIDLECAQCHNHLTISHYLQRDFQGLHMIFENVKTRNDLKFPAVSEGVLSEKKEFKSVFEQVAMKTGPLIPGGEEVSIPTFEKGQEYLVEPDRKARMPGVPKFSPLEELSERLASPQNDLFTRNIVNRLWWVMMGRGLVEPLDLHHADNPPSHPELLDLLASEFAASSFNIRWLVRELTLSKTYQRTTRLLYTSAAEQPHESYAIGLEKRLSPEQLFWSLITATGDLERHRQRLAKEGKASLNSEAVVEQTPDLKSLKRAMIDTFANPPKEPEVDFAPSVKGALFLMHEDQILRLLKPQTGNLIERATSQSDDDTVRELCLCVLTREPADDELATLTDYLKQNADRRDEAIANLTWALLTSTEFVVNH